MKKYIIIFIFSIGTLFSCTDGFDEMNTNPVAIPITQPPVESLFTNALRMGTLNYATYQRGEFLYSCLLSQYWANANSGWATDRYKMNDGWIMYFWDQYYKGFSMDAFKVEQILTNNTDKEINNVNKIQVIKIWRTWMLHRMTDYFGPLPHSQAYRGEEGILHPKYDTQKELYYHMLKELKDAAQNIDFTEKNKFISSDILFKGNLYAWKRFANSLRMRLAMRISYIDPEKAKEEFLDAYSYTNSSERLIVNNNAENVLLECSKGNYNENNSLAIILTFANERRISKTLVDYLEDFHDPRLPVLVQKVKGTSVYIGLANGIADNKLGTIQHDSYSKAGSKYLNFANPIEIMKYSEICFLKSEAAVNGWISDKTAKEFYLEGMKASFEYHDVEVDIEADPLFYIRAGVKWKTSAARKVILTQKWIALFPNGMEAWAEHRRTGFPILQVIDAYPLVKSSEDLMPRRLMYPNTEGSEGWNKKNQKAAMRIEGPNIMSTRLWWDVKNKK